jgi:hypothetical protein
MGSKSSPAHACARYRNRAVAINRRGCSIHPGSTFCGRLSGPSPSKSPWCKGPSCADADRAKFAPGVDVEFCYECCLPFISTYS